MAEAGRVWAHVGQAFTAQEYDVVVVGAGRMGALTAFYLRQLAPHLSLLLVEEGGLPNEEGATMLMPGVWSARHVPPERLPEAHWAREQLVQAFGDLQWQASGLVELHPGDTGTDPAAGAWQPTAEVLRAHPEALALLDLEALPHARVDVQAAAYRPGLLALHAAQAAIRAGADLMLNTRAHLQAGGPRAALHLERLTVTNTHQVVTHETHTLRAGQLVVAMGAAGPLAVEHDLGVHTTHARAYRQTPRLNAPSRAATPVLRVGGPAGLTLRPQHGGFTLIPTIHHRDPHGYAPHGGKLTGVPTGLRRETLEDLVRLMDSVPALASGALEVGRSLSDVPGAWLALPHGHPGGWPLHQQVGGVHLLLGGPQADTLGLAVACDLAAQIAGLPGRPWQDAPPRSGRGA